MVFTLSTASTATVAAELSGFYVVLRALAALLTHPRYAPNRLLARGLSGFPRPSFIIRDAARRFSITSPPNNMSLSTRLSATSIADVVTVFGALWLVSKIAQRLRQRFRTTPLRGPPRDSKLYGAVKAIENAQDAGLLFEEWAEAYGSVYRVPGALGQSRVILADPKAIAKFYSLENTTFDKTSFARLALDNLLGKGILWSSGESHKRQRKALSPGFTNASMRSITPLFLDSAYKAKAAWDSMIQLSNGQDAVIEVQSWMNRISLDSIGLAAFAHDFGATTGKASPVEQVFAAFNDLKMSNLGKAAFLLAPVIPPLLTLPTARQKLNLKLRAEMGKLAKQLLDKGRSEKDITVQDRSIMGALIKSEEGRLTEEEVLAQMNTLMLAGYETTSVTMTWALIELALNPHVQTKLREELTSRFPSSDPTWDELTNSLPYLDAFCQESLRLHPSVPETQRVALADEVLPLSSPLETANGQLVDHISLAQGTLVSVSLRSINRSKAIWGDDAKEFKPERWIEGIGEKAEQVHGHRHLLTFIDGPRACLGKSFALAEFKAVMSVLVRNYSFELPNGKNTKIGLKRALIQRPRVEGEEGCNVPMLVRRLE